MRENLPIYNVADEATLAPGLYLCLFHGRDSPGQDMNDWGYDGPMIGPLESVHVTYCTHVKPAFVNAADCDRYFDGDHQMDERVGEIQWFEELLVYDGKYYGDWCVQVVGNVLPTAAQMCRDMKETRENVHG